MSKVVKEIEIPGRDGQTAKVTKTVKFPSGTRHHYYVDPYDKKEKRIIVLEQDGEIEE